jgi:hypothetical protein
MFLDGLQLFAVVLNLIIFLDSFVGGLSFVDEEEVVADEDEESEAHDCAHYNKEEEDGLCHE